MSEPRFATLDGRRLARSVICLVATSVTLSSFAAGVYFARVRAGSYSATRSLVVLN